MKKPLLWALAALGAFLLIGWIIHLIASIVSFLVGLVTTMVAVAVVATIVTLLVRGTRRPPSDPTDLDLSL